jgi:hypothetical protein
VKGVRILLASDKEGLSRLLEKMEVGEDKAVIVGQADNVNTALILAKKLRPDLAIIDTYLPYTVGLKDVPLSRAGGLDAAQIISLEIPNARVMLLNNLDNIKLLDSDWNSDALVHFEEDCLGPTVPLDLRKLSREKDQGPVFAKVELQQRPLVKPPAAHYTDEIVIFGGVGILLGLIMMLTLILFIPGLVLACAGAAASLVGFSLKKILNLLDRKASR